MRKVTGCRCRACALGNRRAWSRERRRPRPTPLATPRRVPPRRRGPQVLRRGAEPIGGAELSAVQEPGPGALPSGSAQIPAAVAAAPMGGGCGQAGSCRTDSLSLSSRSEGSGSSRWDHRACQAGPAVASSAGCRAASQPVWSTDEGRWLLHGRLLAPSEDSVAVPCDVGCDELVPCVTPEASRRNTGLRVFRGNGSNCLGHDLPVLVGRGQQFGPIVAAASANGRLRRPPRDAGRQTSWLGRPARRAARTDTRG